jgi:hypothetical protein
MSKQHSTDPVLRRRARALASVRGIPYTAALRSLTEAKTVADTHAHPGLHLAQAGKYAASDKPWDDAADRVIGAARAGCAACQTVGMAEVTDHAPTLTMVAASVWSVTPAFGLASAVTRSWAPKAQTARTAEEWQQVTSAVTAMDPADRYALLDDALDLFAAGAGQVQIHTIDLDDPSVGDQPSRPTYLAMPNTITAGGRIGTSKAGPPWTRDGDFESRSPGRRWNASCTSTMKAGTTRSSGVPIQRYSCQKSSGTCSTAPSTWCCTDRSTTPDSPARVTCGRPSPGSPSCSGEGETDEYVDPRRS